MNPEARVIHSSGGKIFRLAATSGLITAITADGVLFAFRNPSASVLSLWSNAIFVDRTFASSRNRTSLDVAGRLAGTTRAGSLPSSSAELALRGDAMVTGTVNPSASPFDAVASSK